MYKNIKRRIGNMKSLTYPLIFEKYQPPEISFVAASAIDVICASTGINLPDVSLENFSEYEIM